MPTYKQLMKNKTILINLMQQRTYLKVEDFYNGEFDNHFIINESMIEKGSY